jgi:adenylosuccinate synthase
MLYLAAGSEIDPGVLLAEIRDLDLAGYGVSHRLEIHPQATLVEQRHKDHESYVALLETCGSTVKGVGSARADRAMRFASLVTDHPALADYSAHGATPQRYLATGYDVLIEGTQGYGLGLHAGNYPQCTSGDCTAMDFLAQAGVAPWRGKVGFEVWVVFRAYPIRVAGNSGPLADETTWADLGLPVEHTTVTRKVRRVGGWDMSLAADAMLANGHPSPNVHVALTMVDHVVPGVAGVATMGGLQACPRDTVTQYENYIQQRTSSLGHSIDIIGTGPSTVLDRFAVPEELTRYGF